MSGDSLKVMQDLVAAQRRKRDSGVLDLPLDKLELVLTAHVGRACAGGAGARDCWIDLAAIALHKAREATPPGGVDDGTPPPARTDVAGDPLVARAIREMGPDSLPAGAADDRMPPAPPERHVRQPFRDDD